MREYGSPLLRSGFAQAEAITRRYAHTFYLSSLFLPAPVRRGAYAVYAVCRISDESVDTGSEETRHRALDSIGKNIQACYGTGEVPPLFAAFRATVNAYGIPKALFDELLAGMEMDLRVTRYETFAQLQRYCYLVAGTVGLIMLRLFQVDDAAAQEPAKALGEAMQLTNILRDVREDHLRDRIYLPREDLLRFGVTEEDIAQGRYDTDRWRALMRALIGRARERYALADTGLSLIRDPDCRRVVLLMRTLYAAILEVIEARQGDVFTRRAVVSLPRKLRLTARILLKRSLP